MYPEDEAYAVAETGQETEAGDGGVRRLSGSLSAGMGEDYCGLHRLVVRFTL